MRKANTNVISVKLGTLTQDVPVATGTPRPKLLLLLLLLLLQQMETVVDSSLLSSDVLVLSCRRSCLLRQVPGGTLGHRRGQDGKRRQGQGEEHARLALSLLRRRQRAQPRRRGGAYHIALPSPSAAARPSSRVFNRPGLLTSGMAPSFVYRCRERSRSTTFLSLPTKPSPAVHRPARSSSSSALTSPAACTPCCHPPLVSRCVV